MTHYGLRISEYRACRACTCALAPAADEYNLNVVDCNALSLSHAGLPSQSVGVWGVPPAAGGKRTAGGKRKMVFRGLPRACWEFFVFFSDKGSGWWEGAGQRASSVGRPGVVVRRSTRNNSCLALRQHTTANGLRLKYASASRDRGGRRDQRNAGHGTTNRCAALRKRRAP